MVFEGDARPLQRSLSQAERATAGYASKSVSELERIERKLNDFSKRMRLNTKGMQRYTGVIRNRLLLLRFTIATMTAPIALMAKNFVNAAVQMQNAMMGLSSVAVAMRESMQEAQMAARALAADGLITITEAAAGLKNILATHIGLDKAVELMNAFKDSAAFNRQGTLAMGEAIVGASQGFKNFQSIMVDNAGITKNLDLILKDYLKTVGKTKNEISEYEKNLAVANGLIKLAAIYHGDAARMAGNFSGQLQAMKVQIFESRAAIGEGLQPAMTVLNTSIWDSAKALGVWARENQAAISTGMSTQIDALIGKFKQFGAVAAGLGDSLSKIFKGFDPSSLFDLVIIFALLNKISKVAAAKLASDFSAVDTANRQKLLIGLEASNKELTGLYETLQKEAVATQETIVAQEAASQKQLARGQQEQAQATKNIALIKERKVASEGMYRAQMTAATQLQQIDGASASAQGEAIVALKAEREVANLAFAEEAHNARNLARRGKRHAATAEREITLLAKKKKVLAASYKVQIANAGQAVAKNKQELAMNSDMLEQIALKQETEGTMAAAKLANEDNINRAMQQELELRVANLNKAEEQLALAERSATISAGRRGAAKASLFVGAAGPISSEARGVMAATAGPSAAAQAKVGAAREGVALAQQRVNLIKEEMNYIPLRTRAMTKLRQIYRTLITESKIFAAVQKIAFNPMALMGVIFAVSFLIDTFRNGLPILKNFTGLNKALYETFGIGAKRINEERENLAKLLEDLQHQGIVQHLEDAANAIDEYMKKQREARAMSGVPPKPFGGPPTQLGTIPPGSISAVPPITGSATGLPAYREKALREEVEQFDSALSKLTDLEFQKLDPALVHQYESAKNLADQLNAVLALRTAIAEQLNEEATQAQENADNAEHALTQQQELERRTRNDTVAGISASTLRSMARSAISISHRRISDEEVKSRHIKAANENYKELKRINHLMYLLGIERVENGKKQNQEEVEDWSKKIQDITEAVKKWLAKLEKMYEDAQVLHLRNQGKDFEADMLARKFAFESKMRPLQEQIAQWEEQKKEVHKDDMNAVDQAQYAELERLINDANDKITYITNEHDAETERLKREHNDKLLEDERKAHEKLLKEQKSHVDQIIREADRQYNAEKKRQQLLDQVHSAGQGAATSARGAHRVHQRDEGRQSITDAENAAVKAQEEIRHKLEVEKTSLSREVVSLNWLGVPTPQALTDRINTLTSAISDSEDEIKDIHAAAIDERTAYDQAYFEFHLNGQQAMADGFGAAFKTMNTIFNKWTKHQIRSSATLNQIWKAVWKSWAASAIASIRDYAETQAAVQAAEALAALAKGIMGDPKAFGAAATHAASAARYAAVSLVAAPVAAMASTGAENAMNDITKQDNQDTGTGSGGTKGSGAERTTLGVTTVGQPINVFVQPTVNFDAETLVIGPDSIEAAQEAIGTVTVDAIQDALDDGSITLEKVDIPASS